MQKSSLRHIDGELSVKLKKFAGVNKVYIGVALKAHIVKFISGDRCSDKARFPETKLLAPMKESAEI